MVDGLVKSQKSSHSRGSGSPQQLDVTGFLLEFIPYLIRGRNDKKGTNQTFYESIMVIDLFPPMFSKELARYKGCTRVSSY
jgi:hypothetical protein